MYMLVDVGSEIIHYSLVPCLLPSQYHSHVPQSQAFAEHGPVLIHHQLSEAIRYLVSIFVLQSLDLCLVEYL